MKKSALFRQIVGSGRAVIMPGAFDAMSAKLVEAAGFKTGLITGAGIANTQLGVPDVGLTTLTECAQQVARICEATEIPFLADGDTGYGNAINVRRTIREFERAGAAGVNLEDQVFPKRCGHFAGKQVISREEMVGKIRAAVEARVDPDFAIVARTDARASLGMDEAISRARAYIAAGADLTFVEAPRSVEELRRIGRELGPLVPQMANMVEGGLTPILPLTELAAMGFTLVAYANAAQRGAIRGMQRVLAGLAAHTTTETVLDDMATWEERVALTGLPEIELLERRYGTGSGGDHD